MYFVLLSDSEKVVVCDVFWQEDMHEFFLGMVYGRYIIYGCPVLLSILLCRVVLTMPIHSFGVFEIFGFGFG